MKKIKLLTIYCILGIVPFTCYAEDDEYQVQCKTSLTKYKSFQNDDDYFCYVSEQYAKATGFKCFKSDSKYCVTHTAVCILGSKTDLSKVVWTDTNNCAPTKVNPGGVWEMSCHKERPKYYNNGIYTIGNALLGYRTCAVSYEGPSVSDTWFHYDLKPIENCPGIKWQSSSKNSPKALLVVEDKPVLSDDKLPLEYYVRHYNRNMFPEICIGYYCPDASGKYTEPCDDGTCAPCKPKEETKPAPKKENNTKKENDTKKKQQLIYEYDRR